MEQSTLLFSSITHLGNPALIGFIVRPTTVPRNTYKNIKATGILQSIITEEMISDAHHTSANYESGVSEFSKTNLKEYNKEASRFHKGSPQLYCKYVNEYYIKENDTVHIIASIESLFLMKT
jgi:flavin reductase (DIM6/NTAB) family NADH-FMN oxidoreductase RutF